MGTRENERNRKTKILLLLLSGIALGFSRSPRGYFKILKGVSEAWREIERNRLYRIKLENFTMTALLTTRKTKTALGKSFSLKKAKRKV